MVPLIDLLDLCPPPIEVADDDEDVIWSSKGNGQQVPNEEKAEGAAIVGVGRYQVKYDDGRLPILIAVYSLGPNLVVWALEIELLLDKTSLSTI